MPAKAQWLLKIPQILRELAALEEPVLDRAAVERLFGLKRRQAINLLHRFGGYQAGHAFLVDRLRLIRQVEELRESPEVAFETRRRVKVGESLERCGATP